MGSSKWIESLVCLSRVWAEEAVGECSVGGMHFGFQFLAEWIIVGGPEVKYVPTEYRGKITVIVVGHGYVHLYVVQMRNTAIYEEQGGRLAEVLSLADSCNILRVAQCLEGNADLIGIARM